MEAGMHTTQRKPSTVKWLAVLVLAAFAAVALGTATAQSVDELRAAVAERPGDAVAWTDLGDGLLAVDDLAGAKEAYLEAIALDYLVGDAHYGLGLAEFGRGDFAAALFAFNEVARLYPERFDGHFNRAVTLARLRRPAESAEAFRRSLDEAAPEATGEDRLAAWTGLGGQLVLAGDPGAAADAYGEALALSPDDTGLAYRRGSALVDAGRGLEALAELTEIEARTSDYRFSALIARVYVEQGQVDYALRALERAVRKADDAGDRAGQAASLVALGDLQRGLGRDADAAASFRAAADADPASWQARYALALAYLQGGQARSAVAPLQEAVAIVPDDGNVRLALASAYDQVGQAGDALVAARAALPLLTEVDAQAQARFIAGRSLYLQGNFANADAEFAQVVELRPSSASAQLWAGLTKYQLGDHAGAVFFYERAVQLDPNSVAARVNLGASYLAVERYRDAEGVYRLLVQQNPRDAESFHNLGWSLYAQQNDEGARGAWASSCQLGYQPACSAPR
jgi:tetratricopeptide (TPR) repeat protein